MKLNLTQADIDRLRGHARDGGAIKGEELLNLLQDWVTLERAVQFLESVVGPPTQVSPRQQIEALSQKLEQAHALNAAQAHMLANIHTQGLSRVVVVAKREGMEGRK